MKKPSKPRRPASIDAAFRHSLNVASAAADEAVKRESRTGGDAKLLAHAQRQLERLDAKRRRVAERGEQLERRGRMLRAHYADAVRLCDAIIVEAAMRAGGISVDRLDARGASSSDPQAAPWGIWLRDLKRAIDAAPGNELPPPHPFPPLPSWWVLSPGRAALAARLGIISQA